MFEELLWRSRTRSHPTLPSLSSDILPVVYRRVMLPIVLLFVDSEKLSFEYRRVLRGFFPLFQFSGLLGCLFEFLRN